MNKEVITKHVKAILEDIEGELHKGDTDETPERVYRALEELLAGYKVNVNALFKAFDGEGMDQIVMVRDIEFTSWCRHHLLPFRGVAHVAYLPNGKAIGASKLPRLVQAYAKRLQLQERIAEQVANTLMEKLKPKGVAVVIQAQHSCMQCRGVNSSGSSMVNSIMLGAFRDDASLRAEVLMLMSLPRNC
jgi:GTP cyclohydrolase I